MVREPCPAPELTIDLPPEGSLDRQPTNAVAETNVVVNLVKKGDTNHITCDRAIYTYVVSERRDQRHDYLYWFHQPARQSGKCQGLDDRRTLDLG
jgi:hypothetical protein